MVLAMGLAYCSVIGGTMVLAMGLAYCSVIGGTMVLTVGLLCSVIGGTTWLKKNFTPYKYVYISSNYLILQEIPLFFIPPSQSLP